ncbi:spermatogenesis associated 2-like [Pseudoliparis swirei]|uniref:spermatogenesis associated 2-like n=1 Tax=Pseudoliparis swirei TaxID=2059687 RepID=UPI0024BDDA73|nr:spermatogenesis associated 2-like [Pseudoliparis swirei]
MSVPRQSARALVAAYGLSLEQQIVGRGSNLACRDEGLWTQAELLLRGGGALETHCLGLDPLGVMEESLAAAAMMPAAGAGRVRTRGGLQGLAKAFEVLEQAALNLYLGPWRDEYKVVKMYSGMFTHNIKPVLSMPQIEKLFGLLGYQPSSSRHEQLRLRPPAVGSASPEDLLCLSCAFFLARCECGLLLAALGKHGGEAQWELSAVRERQSGTGVQVALDNTRKTLGAGPPYDGEVDLYTDEHINGRQDDAPPPSLSSASPPPAAPSIREHACVSKLDCQLTTPPGRCQSAASAGPLCECHHIALLCLRRCVDCDVTHDVACASFQRCRLAHHRIELPDSPAEEEREFRAPSPHGVSLRAAGASPTLSGGDAMSSFALCDAPGAMMPPLHPIAYHGCCDLARPDPRALCVSCGVFHAGTCRDIAFCQSHHDLRPLGVCACGRECSRKPLVLCRYCGSEYCSDCWYRSPVACSCGQTFDQSSPV